MELEFNDRGNLIVPASRVQALLASVALTLVFAFVDIWFHLDFDTEDTLSTMSFITAIVVVATTIYHLHRLWLGDLEFDAKSRLVKRGKRVLVRFDHVLAVEIRERDGRNAGFSVVLRTGRIRHHVVLDDVDPTTASLDAATIARVLDKPVKLVTL